MLTNNLSRALVPVRSIAQQKRAMSAIAGPATNHLSKAEELISGAIMFSAWLFTPAWVLVHMKEYRGGSVSK